MYNREITHDSENKTLMKKRSIGCKHQIFFLLPFERNICQK